MVWFFNINFLGVRAWIVTDQTRLQLHAPDSLLQEVLRELKQRRFWAIHVNRKWTFCILLQWFYPNFWQMDFIRERTLSSSIVVAFRYFKWERASLPVDVRRSKTSLLKFPVGVGWRQLFEGSDYFKYLRQREAINRGTAITRGNTVSGFHFVLIKVKNLVTFSVFCESANLLNHVSVFRNSTGKHRLRSSTAMDPECNAARKCTVRTITWSTTLRSRDKGMRSYPWYWYTSRWGSNWNRWKGAKFTDVSPMRKWLFLALRVCISSNCRIIHMVLLSLRVLTWVEDRNSEWAWRVQCILMLISICWMIHSVL